MTTQNVIVVESADQVTAVPSIAVFTRPGGEDYVRLLRPDGSVEERTVETGLSNNMLTEIRSGLQAGDRVVSAQMTQAEAAARAGSMRGPRR